MANMPYYGDERKINGPRNISELLDIIAGHGCEPIACEDVDLRFKVQIGGMWLRLQAASAEIVDGEGAIVKRKEVDPDSNGLLITLECDENAEEYLESQ